MSTLLAIGLAYFLGSVPFALIVARRWGGAGHLVDLRTTGSGNIGATNVARALGMTAGIVVALLDMAKGAAAVLIAERLDGSAAAAAGAGLAAIVGHVYPVWLRFRGGKGVATAFGVFAALAPAAAVVALVVFAAAVWLARYVSLGSVLAAASVPPLTFATGSPLIVIEMSAAAAALVIFRHRSNIARLLAGTERRLAPRAPVPH